MPARLIPVDRLPEADVSRWRELAAASIEPNPFFEPEFVLPAAEALAARETSLLVVEEGGDWRALVPVQRVRRWRRVPLPGLATWRHSYCFLGTPLACAEGLDRSLTTLVRFALASRFAGFFGLDMAGADGPVSAALTRLAGGGSFRRTELARFERATLRRRDDGSYLSIKPKHRREYRRQRDRLSEQLGAPLETTDEAGRAASVGDFAGLEASGWKGRAGTAFADDDAHARFLGEICARFAAQGRLQLLALRAGDRAVAMKCNLRAGAALFCFKIAFDEEWARYSPGMLLELDNVARFHHDPGLMWMDSCADPGNEMINRLWPDRRTLSTAALTRPVAGTLPRTAFRAAGRARGTLKGNR